MTLLEVLDPPLERLGRFGGEFIGAEGAGAQAEEGRERHGDRDFDESNL